LLTILLSSYVVFWNLGYRAKLEINLTLKTFDFEIYRAGSIKINIKNQQNFKIFINKKEYKTFQINGLKPGIYQVKISGDNILDYKISTEVKSGKLTQIDATRFFLKKPKKDEREKDLGLLKNLKFQSFYISPDENFIILQTKSSVSVFDKDFNQISENLGGDIKNIFISEKNVFLVEKDVFSFSKKDRCRGYILENGKFSKKISSGIKNNIFCEFFIENESFVKTEKNIINYQTENEILNFEIKKDDDLQIVSTGYFESHPINKESFLNVYKNICNLNILSDMILSCQETEGILQPSSKISNNFLNFEYRKKQFVKFLTIKTDNEIKNFGVLENSILEIFEDMKSEKIFVSSSKIIDAIFDPNSQYIYILDEKGKIFVYDRSNKTSFLVMNFDQNFSNGFLSISTKDPTKIFLFSQDDKKIYLKIAFIFAKFEKRFIVI